MATVFELHDQQGRLVSMTLISVRSEGPLAPRLVLTFECRPSHPYTQARLTRLKSDIRFEMQLLGTAQMREIVEDVRSSGSHVTLEAPISREALAYIDEHVRSRWVELMFEFTGFLEATKQAPGPNGHVESPEWTEYVVRSGQNTERVSRDEWIGSVVEPLGGPSHLWLDLALPQPPNGESWQAAVEHLRAAEHFYHEGNDPEVLHRCYAAFSALPGAPKGIFDGLEVADPDKGATVDKALLAFRNYLQAGRHVSSSGTLEGEFPVDRRDAEFALSQTKLWLTYIARLLANTKR